MSQNSALDTVDLFRKSGSVDFRKRSGQRFRFASQAQPLLEAGHIQEHG